MQTKNYKFFVKSLVVFSKTVYSYFSPSGQGVLLHTNVIQLSGLCHEFTRGMVRPFSPLDDLIQSIAQ